jgi:hypothetical protein
MVRWTFPRIRHVGAVNLLDESRELDESDSEQGWCGLCGPRDAADMVPRLKGVGPDGAVVGCRHAVTG